MLLDEPANLLQLHCEAGKAELLETIEIGYRTPDQKLVYKYYS